MAGAQVPSSFRDPAGYLFRQDGVLYRQIDASFEPQWRSLVESGLLTELIRDGLLVGHEEQTLPLGSDATAVIRPVELPFISYPYEWSFSQLRDAAVLTLDLMTRCLDRGFCLRDASAYNVQFHEGAPIFIDTLSFEPYREGSPWQAYGQFCRHFLAPLALMSRVDLRLGMLLRDFLDGIPLDLAARLLPRSTRFGLGLGVHVHLHARSQSKEHAGGATARVSKQALLGMVDSLKRTIQALPAPSDQTVWKDYYDHTNYTREAFEAKKDAVADLLGSHRLGVVWDLGANMGIFSEIASKVADLVVAFDLDPQAVDKAWRLFRAEGQKNIVPLVMDFSNPSPGLGWAHLERESLSQRGPADAVLALALVHHLAIGNNVPLARVFEWLSTLTSTVIIEFVPKEDSQVKRMLASREDVFPNYTEAGFEAAAGERFKIVSRVPIKGTARILYRLEGL